MLLVEATSTGDQPDSFSAVDAVNNIAPSPTLFVVSDGGMVEGTIAGGVDEGVPDDGNVAAGVCGT